jgi:hypothetical protein
MTIPTVPVVPAGPAGGPDETPPARVPLRDAPCATPVQPASFRETLAGIKARPEELRWATIPWQTDLWEARRLARDAGKPLFLWAMNGNPLGCV